MARWRWHLAALAIYFGESWLFLDHGASLTRDILGSSEDPEQFIWFLAWWPWALSHLVSSYHTNLQWQPVGINLAWTTLVPLLTFLAWPAVKLSGPVLAYNLLTLAGPALAACGAYALCLDLFEAPAAALAGGWLFGFSGYEAAESVNHPNLSFTVFVPLLALVALRRVNGRLRRLGGVAGLAALLGGEFLISPEILATLCLFGGLGWGLGYAMLPDQRAGLRRLAADAMLAAPLALMVAAPIIYVMGRDGPPTPHPANWPWTFSADLLNFATPTRETWLGGAWAAPLSNQFSGGLDEQGAYLGLPCVIFLILTARARYAIPLSRFMLVMLGIVLVASLGPRLMVAGHPTGIFLPWLPMLAVPLIKAALPVRLMLYADLLVAIMLAGWVAAAPERRRLGVALAACLAVAPALHQTQRAPDSTFFRPGRVQAVLGPAPRLLVLPFGGKGPSSYWQAESGFAFTQVGGYLGFPPQEMLAYPAVWKLYAPDDVPGILPLLQTFCRATGVDYVVAAPGTQPWLRAALAALPWPRRQVDDVTIYTVPPAPHG